MFNLSIERQRKKLTQQALAEKLGVSRNMIARYESGLSIPPVDRLKRLSEILEVTMDYLSEE